MSPAAKWKQVYVSDQLYMIMTAVEVSGVWVMRGLRGIYGYHPQENRILWEIHGIDEGIAHTNHTMAAAGGIVTASVFLGPKEERRAWLLGIDPLTGNALWQRRVGWNTLSTGQFGGLSTADGHVVLIEEQAGEPVILWLNPANGETAAQSPGIKANNRGVTAGGFIYFYRRRRGGIVRVPARPDNSAPEQVSDQPAKSMTALESHLYAIQDLLDGETWRTTARWWDAETFSLLGEMIIPDDDGYQYPRLLPTELPHQVFAAGRSTCGLLDLKAQVILWERAFPKDISYPAWTPDGVFFSIFDQTMQPHLLDKATGDELPFPFSKLQSLRRMGEWYLGSPFGAETRIYAPAEASVPSQDDGRPWPSRAAAEVVVEKDVPPDPRDGLERALVDTRKGGKLDPVFEQTRQLLGIRTIPIPVRRFLELLRDGGIPQGPLAFTPWVQLARHSFSYQQLFSYGPGGEFFPAILIASEPYGVQFWLLVISGKVIALHHDATFFEVALDQWSAGGGDVERFVKGFTAAGSLFDIAQLQAFQEAFAGRSFQDLAEDDPAEIFTAVAAAFGWTLAELWDRIEHPAMEFAYWLFRDHAVMLEQMASSAA